MRPIPAFLAVAALATALSAQDFKPPTPAELAMKDVAFAPGAPAVVLDWEQRRDDNNWMESETVRIKILSKEGLKYADVEIPYDGEMSDVGRIRARQIKPDGTVVPFDGRIYDKTVLRGVWKGRGVRIAAKAFTFPDVVVGSILEYRSETGLFHIHGKVLYTTDFDVQSELPLLHAFVSITPYNEARSQSVLTYRLPPGSVPKQAGRSWELEMTNVPPLRHEPFEPPLEETRPNIKLTYNLERMDTAKYWAKEGEKLSETIEHFIGDRPAVRDEARAALAGAAGRAEQLQKLYARAEQVRNLTLEPEKTKQESSALRANRSAEDVLRNGYGTSDDINRLFVALARAAGFDVSVVRVADRSERFFVKEQQRSEQLNDEIAMVALDGKTLFCDPGTPFAPFGILAWQKTGVSGMKIGKDGAASWIDIPEQPPLAATTRRTVELHLDHGTMTATVVVMRMGQEALAQRLELLNDDDTTAKQHIVNATQKWFPDGATVKLTDVSGLRNPSVPLIERYEVTLPSTAIATGSRLLLPMSVCTSSQGPPFTAGERKNPIYFEYRYRTDDVVTLEVPEGYEIESLPPAARRDLGGLSFHSETTSTGGRIRLVRNVTVDAVLIDRAKYDVVRDFFNALATADQQPVVLRKTVR